MRYRRCEHTIAHRYATARRPSCWRPAIWLVTVCERPAWITGIDHRIETHSLGARDLAKSPSAALAAEKAGIRRGLVDVAELHAPFSHQEIILREAMRLGDDVDDQPVRAAR